MRNLVARGARPAALSPLDSVRAHRPIGDGRSAVSGEAGRRGPIRRGAFSSVPPDHGDHRYLAQHNENRQPFTWTQTAEHLTKVRRGPVPRDTITNQN